MKIVILFVGHLRRFKGIFELIYAFFEVNNENKKAKLMIVGERTKRILVKEKLIGLGLEKSVILIGKIHHLKFMNTINLQIFLFFHHILMQEALHWSL